MLGEAYKKKTKQVAGPAMGARSEVKKTLHIENILKKY